MYSSEEARDLIMNGAQMVYDAVSSTYGASGSNVMIIQTLDSTITNDGTTIANNVFSDNKVEQASIRTIRSASAGADLAGGDGTSNAVILAYHMLKNGYQAIEEDSILPIHLRDKMQYMRDKIVNGLDDLMFTPNDEDLRSIALIAVNNDDDLAELIMQAYDEVDLSGRVSVLPNRDDSGDYYDVIEGAVYPAQLATPSFIPKGQVSLPFDNTDVLITNIPINAGTPLLWEDGTPVMDEYVKSQKQLVIIVNGIDPLVVERVAILNSTYGCNISFVNSAYFAQRKLGFYLDVCAITGATYLNSEGGSKLNSLKKSDIGTIPDGHVSMSELVIRGIGNDDTYNEHLDDLKVMFKKDPDTIDRYQNLTDIVAIIHIGGESELEMREKFLRVQDSVNAVKHSLESGCVIGGGRALGIVGLSLNPNDPVENMMRKALLAPQNMIIENARFSISEKKSKSGNFFEDLSVEEGVDIRSHNIGNMREMGVIDPLNVIKSSFLNALSNMSTLLSIKYVVIEDHDII